MVILVIYKLYSGLYKWLSWLYIDHTVVIQMVILVINKLYSGLYKWLSWLYIDHTEIYTNGFLGYI
jgi:hypothetical protein